MPLQIVPFADAHIADAAHMVAARCRVLRERVPVLPPRYAEAETLAAMLANHPPGVAALRGDQLAGFMVAYSIGEFRGKPSTFCPEWGHAADPQDAASVYQAMYTHLAREWMAQDKVIHLITIPAHDRPAIETWHWLGFGFIVGDALRPLTPVPGTVPVTVRRAGPSDLDAVVDLVGALREYMAASPIFLRSDQADPRKELADLLADPLVAIWLAELGGKAVGFIKFVPSDRADASHIVRDPGTVSITGAYTRPHVRGHGVATAALDRGLAWAREQGYARCAVDFETMNVPAARFWTRHFELVCLSLMRYSDERLAG